MNDYRVEAVKKAVNALGWTCESYDDSKSMLKIKANGQWMISFADKREIGINVPVMVLPENLVYSGLASTLLQMTNGKCNYVRFELVSNYVIACSSISSTVFSRTDYERELTDDLEAIGQEMVAGTRALEAILSKYS